MAAEITPDYKATGTAILSDSYDYPVQEGATDEGINGTIRFSRYSLKRDITVQFRSAATLGAFRDGLCADDGLLVSYEGKLYYLDSLSCSSTYGGFGSADTGSSSPVWEFDISLKSPSVGKNK